jgi:hypothetical protein
MLDQETLDQLLDTIRRFVRERLGAEPRAMMREAWER